MRFLGVKCGWAAAAPRPAGGIWWLAIALLALGAYSNSFPGAFILDDMPIVRDNPLVARPSLGAIFAADYWGEGAGSGLHRPLTILSLAANRMALGASAASFHAVNVMLHAAVSVLVCAVASANGLGPAAAWLAAAMFAVHPMHTEVVNIVTGRAELLSALFLLLALLVALHRGRLHRSLASALYLAGLLSKESAAVFLPLLLACDLFAARSLPSVFRERWRIYASLVAVSAGWLAWRELGLLSAALPANMIYPEDNPLVLLGPAGRILTILKVQAIYLGRLLFPRTLNAVFVDTMIGPVRELASPQGILLVSGAVALGGALVAGWRRRAPWSLGLVMYAVSFAVTANILVLTPFLVAERFAYLPSVGFCLAAAAAGQCAARKAVPGGLLRVVAAATILAALAGRTLVRNPDFASAVELWSAETRTAPANFRAWILLGGARAETGDASGAEAALRRALELRPHFVESALAMGFFLLGQGRPAEAAHHFQSVIDRGPGESPLAMFGMVEAYLALGRPGPAEAWLEAVPGYFRHQPAYAELAARVRAAVLAQRGAGR